MEEAGEIVKQNSATIQARHKEYYDHKARAQSGCGRLSAATAAGQHQQIYGQMARAIRDHQKGGMCQL